MESQLVLFKMDTCSTWCLRPSGFCFGVCYEQAEFEQAI